MTEELSNYQVFLNNVIGIIGTIIGAFIGWLLSISTQMGKVSSYINNTKIEYYEFDGAGVMGKNDELNINTQYGILYFEVDFINTSGHNRMLRNIHCSIKVSDNNNSKILHIDDVETKRFINQQNVFDRFEIMNIQAKSIIKKKLSIKIPSENIIQEKFKTSDIFLSFTQCWGFKKTRKKYFNYIEIRSAKKN